MPRASLFLRLLRRPAPPSRSTNSVTRRSPASRAPTRLHQPRIERGDERQRRERPGEIVGRHILCNASCLSGRCAMAASRAGTSTETVARVTEITARSSKSFEEATRVGIERATKTLRHVQGAWIKEQRVEIEEGKIIGYQVNLLITFLLEDTV